MSYIETLVTPHPARYPGTEQEPLLDAAGISHIQPYVDHAPDQEAAKDSVIEHLQTVVRRALQFPSRNIQDRLYKGNGSELDSLEEVQETNCIGYSVVGSECLQAADIGHYVAYANGHFFLATSRAEGTQLHSVDMLSPELSHNVTPYLEETTAEEVIGQLDSSPDVQQVAVLNTGFLAGKLQQPMEQIAYSYPWIETGRRSPRLSGRFDSREQVRSAYNCIMTLYSAEIGRTVMVQYVRFRHAVTHQDITTATAALQELAGRYPENDCRASHSQIRELVGLLCLQGSAADAESAIYAYCSSFRTPDPRAIALRGDLLRRVAVITKDPKAATEAADSYRCASERTAQHLPGISSAYLNKSFKMSAMAERMRSTHAA